MIKGEDMWKEPTDFDCKKIKSEIEGEITLYKWIGGNYSVPYEGWYLSLIHI